jgi:DNA polymerase III delta prime subunit
MRKESPAGTGLETALRVNKDPIASFPLPLISEKDRYFTVESDPSQEKAVFRARQSPGLLIEGPPGTGKSQTIVNIIGDCIGRKQTVLVVCQKSAALEVLAKRLDAEGLRDRFFYITHVNKDRPSVVQSIRTQIEGLVESMKAYRSENVERERDDLAEKIEKLEGEIDKHHGAIHTIDDVTGLSYRILLGQLIDLEDNEIRLIDAPGLRRLLIDLNQKQLTAIEETCSPIAGIWLASSFEGNPLASLKLFSSDTALTNEFINTLFAFIDKEKKRDEVNRSTVSFDVEDPTPHQEWVKFHDKLLKKVDWRNISSWFHLFTENNQSNGTEILKQLQELKQSLISLDLQSHDPLLSIKLIELPTATVENWLSLAKSSTAPKSFFSRLNPLLFIKHRRIQNILIKLGETPTPERILQFQNAAELEFQQRPMREATLKFLETLYQETRISSPLFLKELRLLVDHIIEELILAQNGILALHACPCQEEIESIVKAGLPAYQDLVTKYDEAFLRHQARFNSLEALDRLSSFFCETLFNTCRVNIGESRSNIADLQPIVEALPSLSAYQEFRLQALNLSSEALKIFATLREKDKDLREYPSEELETIVSRLIAREARLAWKDRIEQKFPILRLAQKELSRKIQTLDASNAKIRKLNRRFLAFNLDVEKVRHKDWESLIRLRGPRLPRLREIIERGWDIGLMNLRPVWLMNPDTASQLLPLRAGMFDVIIFDEASQIPIENALPTLYRAKRAVISGDEKQMPPTNVFMRRLVDDEDHGCDDEDLDDMMSAAERDALEDTWNRREIKDCSDLLSLGKTVLPRSMLQIHYRSKYRELIAFSNAAFYGNHLSVPVRHPESVIQNIRPIEVIRVDGVYANQTNRQEAEKVVDLLAEKWLSHERPSIGVVTFNAKQADLIEDVLAECADNDPVFRQALSHERAL